MVDCVLFDLDGTLVDTAADFVEVLNIQRLAHNLPPLDALTVRNTVSDGSRALTKLAFGGEPGEPNFEQNRLELLKLYEAEAGKAALLFPGMHKLLEGFALNAIRWGIVTNKPRLYTELLLSRMAAHSPIINECNIVVCADDLKQAKPHPEGILKALDALNAKPVNSLYIGDHERDIIAGKAAGTATVAVTFGYVDDPSIIPSWNADLVINHPLDLNPLINLKF
jgi:phosphoglycolate phosphatase